MNTHWASSDGKSDTRKQRSKFQLSFTVDQDGNDTINSRYLDLDRDLSSHRFEWKAALNLDEVVVMTNAVTVQR